MLCFFLVVCVQEHESLSLYISGHHTLWNKNRVQRTRRSPVMRECIVSIVLHLCSLCLKQGIY